MRECLKRRMDSQRWRDEIDQRWFVSDLSLAEEFCFRDVPATAMRFNASPVISALQHVLAVFRNFQFDHDQTTILSQRQQIDRSDAELRSACGPETVRAAAR